MEPSLMSQESRNKEDDGGARTSSSSPSGGEADDKAELQKNRAASASNDEEDDGGTRQPYKCTFCRRGFPTAQALGGHMNVHRRHKGRSAAPTTGGPSAAAAAPQGSSSCYAAYDYEQSSASMEVAFGGHSNPIISWTTRSMATPAGGEASTHSEELRPPPHELRLFGRGKQGGGGSQDVREHHRRYYYEKDDRDDGDRGGGEAELDLELRLGGAGS